MTGHAVPALRRSLVRGACFVACAALCMSACGDDDAAVGTTLILLDTATTSPAQPELPSTVATTTQPVATSTAVASGPAATTTAPSAQATMPPGTVSPPTEPAVTDATGQCDPPTGRDTFNDGYPNRMSGMVGNDIRTGNHGCFERVVIELAGPGDMPGVRVEYVEDPVHLSPSDETADIDGDATLVISVAAWMPSMESDGYAGPIDFVPANVSHIRELRQIENFEGMTAWAVGVDSARDFEVTLLEAPARVVVDIAV